MTTEPHSSDDTLFLADVEQTVLDDLFASAADATPALDEPAQTTAADAAWAASRVVFTRRRRASVATAVLAVAASLLLAGLLGPLADFGDATDRRGPPQQDALQFVAGTWPARRSHQMRQVTRRIARLKSRLEMVPTVADW